MYVPVSQRKKNEAQTSTSTPQSASRSSGSSSYVPVSQRSGGASKPASTSTIGSKLGLKSYGSPALQSLQSKAKEASKPKLDLSFLKDIPDGPMSSLQDNNNLAKLKEDRDRGVTISQGTKDPVEESRRGPEFLRDTLIGDVAFGKGKQGPSNSLYTPGSIPQTLVEKGIIGFLFEGFQKKVNPTDAEVGEQIMTRYDKLAETNKDVSSRVLLDKAIQDVINQSGGSKVTMPGQPENNIAKLKEPGVELSDSDKSALRITNLLEDAFAVLDAPIFVGSTKLAKGPITATLKNMDDVKGIGDILKRLGMSKEVIDDVAPEIAKADNELKIAKIIDDATKQADAVKVSDEVVETAKVDSEAFKKAVVEGDTEKAVDDALKVFDNGKGNVVIDPDALKKTAGMTDPKDHETFSKLAKDTYTKALATDTNDTVRFLAGGSGSGKSETILKRLEANDDVKGIIVDGVLADYDSALAKLMEAEKAGKAVEIEAVLPDIARAWKWAQSRAIRTGREVPLKVFVDKHVGFTDTIKRLADDGFKINLADTRQVRNKADLETDRLRYITDPDEIIDTVSKLGYNRDELYKYLSTSDNAKLSEKQIRKAKARREEVRRSESAPTNELAKDSSRGSNKKPRVQKRNGRDPGRSRVKKTKASPEERAKKQTAKADTSKALNAVEISRRVKNARLANIGDRALTDAEKLEYKRLEVEFTKDAVEANPARQLSKYAPKTGENAGSLPEVTGIGKSEWARRGDDISSELGFESTEIAREQFQQYVKQRERLARMIEEVQSHTKEYRETQKVLQALKRHIKQEGATRQKQLSNARDFFHFSTNEWNRILKRTGFQDPRLYTDKQWEEYMSKVQIEGEATFRAIERRVELKALIFEREFKKTENLFQAMGYPRMENMSEQQIGEMIDVLENFKIGDEFLTKRQIETVKHTDINDIRTVREALERLADDAGVERGTIGDVVYKEMDEYRYDSALARQNPFYKVMVTEKNRAFIEAGTNVIKIRERLDDLIGKARSSRKRSISDKLIPTDKRIFNWLEADALGKNELAKNMTAEEIEAGQYIRNLYEQARDYLVQMQVLKKYRSDYITHIRRGFLETWKDDGLLKAFRESFDQYKQDEAYLNILDGDTGQILPLEKFFQFSMQRTGGLVPTKNVAKAVETYFHTFERKVALDSLVPKIDIYAHALSPRVYSDRGLELDRSLKKFVKKWLNTKKGRVAETIVKPGGKIDWILRSGVGLTRILDLGFSIPTGVASFVGEQAVTFTGLGAKKMALGSARMLTKQGQRILKANESFIGESTLTKLRNQASDPGDKLMTGMFALFQESARTANAQWLLGSLTKQELKTGNITAQRLAELRREMGRYRVVEEAESVMGKTSLGKVFTQYRTWAVPVMSTTVDNLKTVSNVVRKDGIKAVMKRPEMHELMRTSILSATVALTMGGYARSLQDKKDKNFAEVLIAKAYRDSMTLIGAMDPNLFASQARFLAFVEDLSQGLTDIVTFEDGLLNPKLDTIKSGQNEGKNRGLNKLGRTLAPKSITQFLKEGGSEKKKSSSSSKPGAPTAPKLPSLPKNGLPKAPELPKL